MSDETPKPGAREDPREKHVVGLLESIGWLVATFLLFGSVAAACIGQALGNPEDLFWKSRAVFLFVPALMFLCVSWLMGHFVRSPMRRLFGRWIACVAIMGAGVGFWVTAETHHPRPLGDSEVDRFVREMNLLSAVGAQGRNVALTSAPAVGLLSLALVCELFTRWGLWKKLAIALGISMTALFIGAALWDSAERYTTLEWSGNWMVSSPVSVSRLEAIGVWGRDLAYGSGLVLVALVCIAADAYFRARVKKTEAPRP